MQVKEKLIDKMRGFTSRRLQLWSTIPHPKPHRRAKIKELIPITFALNRKCLQPIFISTYSGNSFDEQITTFGLRTVEPELRIQRKITKNMRMTNNQEQQE